MLTGGFLFGSGFILAGAGVHQHNIGINPDMFEQEILNNFSSKGIRYVSPARPIN